VMSCPGVGFDILNAPWVTALGWALLHFLWQGAVLVLALWASLKMAHPNTPRVRYGLTCVCLLAMLLCVPLTLWINFDQPSPVAGTTRGTFSFDAGRMASVPAPESRSWPLPANQALPWLVAVWCAGVTTRGAWSVCGWWLARRTALSALGLPAADLMRKALALARRLGVEGRFRLVTAMRGGVPFVFGWLKPVLIVPLATLAGLSSWQLEAVLAHELAHIARRDALANILQTLVECFLFYHPAVWWVSRRMREEREHCCDDLAVTICGDRMEYSKALLALEEMRSAWVLAAGSGRLRARIARLLGKDNSLGGGFMMPLAMLAVLSAFLGGSVLLSGQTAKTTEVKSAAEAAFPMTAGVKGGARGGVPGGVQAGVTGGVPGGVHSGVMGGIAGGVPGGVGNGIAKGVGMGMGSGVGIGSGAGLGEGSQNASSTGGSRPGAEDEWLEYEVGAILELDQTAHHMAKYSQLREQMAQIQASLRQLNRERVKADGREQAAREIAQRHQRLVQKWQNAALRAREELARTRAELRELQRGLDRTRGELLRERPAQIRAREEQLRQRQEESRTRELEFERRIRYVEERFQVDGGKASDRGAVYIAYGPPAEIESHPNERVEIWRYREIPTIGGNVEFRFEGQPMKIVSGPIAKPE